MENKKILCNLYHATTDPNSRPYIIMRNFKEIPNLSNIEIHIPKI